MNLKQYLMIKSAAGFNYIAQQAMQQQNPMQRGKGLIAQPQSQQVNPQVRKIGIAGPIGAGYEFLKRTPYIGPYVQQAGSWLDRRFNPWSKNRGPAGPSQNPNDYDPHQSLAPDMNHVFQGWPQ